MTLDVDRIQREFTRHIRAETVTDPLEMAAYPDFDIEPMPAAAWLRDSSMLGLPPLSELQLEVLLHAERILYEPTFDALGWAQARPVFEIDLAWGKGSGKDYLSRVMLSRGVYLLSCLASPQAYFGMPGSETIAFTNIATAAPQAKHIFFDPWVEMLSRSSYFRSIMDPKANYIDFDKGLKATSGHSSVESQEGQNLIMAVLDEIAGFKTASELSTKKKQQDREPQNSAEGVFKLARSSIRSRFPYTGKLISISFTRFKNDMIDQLVKKAHLELEQIGDESDKYASRAATWEVNPLRRKEDFANDYRDDPLDAQCRYECRPVSSPHRFFKNILAVKRSLNIPLELTPDQIDRRMPDRSLGIEYYYGNDPGNKQAHDGWQVRFDFSALQSHRKPLAIHLDLGITQDLAGVSASHLEGFTSHTEKMVDKNGREFQKVTRKPKIVTDFVVAFNQVKGDPLAGTPDSDIQVRWIRQLVLELMNRGWVIGLFSADGYQSTDTFQLLEQYGIATELYSLDRKTEGYDVLKNLIYGGDVTAPFDPLLFAEIESLVKMTETKIDHQAGMSKDMADAWAGSVRGAIKLLEDGVAGGDDEAWSGMSVEQVAAGPQEEEMRRADVDASVRPRYAPEEEGDFWAGGSVPYNR
jgi:hypothetical protein